MNIDHWTSAEHSALLATVGPVVLYQHKILRPPFPPGPVQWCTLEGHQRGQTWVQADGRLGDPTPAGPRYAILCFERWAPPELERGFVNSYTVKLVEGDRKRGVPGFEWTSLERALAAVELIVRTPGPALELIHHHDRYWSPTVATWPSRGDAWKP